MCTLRTKKQIFCKNGINTYAISFSGAGLLADDGKGWDAVEREKEDVCLDVEVTEGALLGLKVNKIKHNCYHY